MKFLMFRNYKRRIRIAIIGALALMVVGGSVAWLYQRPAPVHASSVGPRLATSTSDCTDNSSIGTVAWTTPGNAALNDGTNAATISLGRNAISHYILCQNFGFTTAMIPTGSTINGIVLTVVHTANNNLVVDSAIRVVKGGVIGSTDRSTTNAWSTTGTDTHGSSTDLWGTTWAVSDITATNFGAAVAATNTNAQAKTAAVYAIQLTVYYTVPATLTQRHYLFQQDDGADVNSNSNNGSADTALTNVRKGERLNARFQVDNTGGDWTGGQFALQYDKNDNSWNNITSSTEIRPGYGASGSNGASLTAASAGTCYTGTSFSNGIWMSGSSWSMPLTIAANACTEVAFVIDTSNATTGTTYRLRLYDQTSGAVLSSYSVYPTLTIVSSANDTIRASKDHIDRLGAPTTCSDTTWDCMTVNTYNATANANDGRYNKFAFDGSGNPWVAAQDNQNSRLVVNVYTPGAAASGTCSANWVCTTVHSDGGVTGFGTGPVLKFDRSGTAWVAEQDYTNKNLYVDKYVGSGGTGCGSGGSTAWTCTKVDGGAITGGDLDIAFDTSGYPWVAYQNYVSLYQMVANYSPGTAASGNCAANWVCTTVATGVNASRGKIAIDSNNNKMIEYNAYASGTSSAIGIITYVGTGGSCSNTAWSCTTLKSGLTNNLPAQTYIVYDKNNVAWAAYHDTAASAFVVAHYVGGGAGTGCTSTDWTCDTVDNDVGGTTNTGDYPGLAFGPTGTLYASYDDATTTGVKVAIMNGNGSGNCTSTAWNCSVVDHSTASMGQWTNIQIDPSGVPWVDYEDATNGDTKIAKLLYPLGKGQMRYKLDNLGYTYIASDDTNLDPLPATTFTPMYRFDTVGSTNSGNIQPTWIGQSSVAASTHNIKLQVYRAGTTNAWVDMATNSTCSASTDCTITPTAISTNLTDYYEASGSQYIVHFRVYQVNGSSQTFKSDCFSASTGCSAGGGSSSPTNDQLMRHGSWFNNGIRMPFTF